MVPRPVNPPALGWSLTLRQRDWMTLEAHLFDHGGEHGAVVLAELVDGPRGPRLLARHVIPAIDGLDYVPSRRGHRALTAAFVRDSALRARTEGLIYIAVHNHRGFERVSFSSVDLTSHERGYPAIAQLTGHPVAGLVLTPAAAAGDIWLPDGTRVPLAELVVPGNNLRRLRPRPAESLTVDERFDRQARLFGDAGQAVLGQMRVAVVGLGGAGSLVTEFLARLGAGHLTLIDDDIATKDNLPRLVGAEQHDIGKPKVQLAERNARRANPSIAVSAHELSAQHPVARVALEHSDWIFLAADTHAARHWVNTVVERHLIPGTQVGVKIPVADDGSVGTIHTACRLLVPGQGCMWCNGLINPTELAIDMAPTDARRQARYVDEVPAPSVITLNAVAVSEAVNHFMLATTGLHENGDDHASTLNFPRSRRRQLLTPRRDPDCQWCGEASPTRPHAGS